MSGQRANKLFRIEIEKRKYLTEKITNILAITEVKKVSEPDDLTCILEIKIRIPEETIGYVDIEDKIDGHEYETDQMSNVISLGNGAQEVTFRSPDLYLGRKLTIVADIYGAYSNDPAEMEFKT